MKSYQVKRMSIIQMVNLAARLRAGGLGVVRKRYNQSLDK